jgi:hypothetical protein
VTGAVGGIGRDGRRRYGAGFVESSERALDRVVCVRDGVVRIHCCAAGVQLGTTSFGDGSLDRRGGVFTLFGDMGRHDIAGRDTWLAL